MAELQAGKVMVGHKIRRAAEHAKLSQSDMAAELGISTSYLNLLENNARPVTVPILFRLGRPMTLTCVRWLRMIVPADRTADEVMSDQVLDGVQMSRRDVHLLASQHPNAATALIMLHQAFDQMRDAAHQGSSRQGEAVTPQPLETVRRVLEEAGRWSHPLSWKRRLSCLWTVWDRPTVQANCAQITMHLEQKYGIRTQIMPQSVMGNLFREFDPHRSRLLLSENLQESQRLFQTRCPNRPCRLP